MFSTTILCCLIGLASAIPAQLPGLKRAACDAVSPAGVTGISYTPDSAESFQTATVVVSQALSASTPSGYKQIFANQQASNNAPDYQGYDLSSTYDVAGCAAKCDARRSCQGFNILFERNPSLEPGSNCPNPPSLTYIKCVLWGGPVTLDNANNVGYTNNDFQVAIAGSNGYTKEGIVEPAGFKDRVYYGSRGIEANDYRVAFQIFQGNFDAGKCAAACKEHTAWAAGQPGEKACKYFNTYYQFINDESRVDGQFCLMYDRVVDASYATAVGQWRGDDWFYVASSWGYTAE